MKITRDNVRAIDVGHSLEVECTPREVQTARSIVSQVSFLEDKIFKTSYDRKTRILTIKHIQNEEQHSNI